MFETTLFLVATLSPALPEAASAPRAIVQDEEKDEEYERRLAEAGDDVAQLWALVEWCQENERAAKRRELCQRILDLDPGHEEAHKALRHHFYDGKWFETYAELSVYRREEAKRMLEEKGLVRFGNDWVPETDLPYLRMGWVKADDGAWVSASKLARLEQEAKYVAEGWKQQDLTWIHPDDFEKWNQGLWKCADQWLALPEANQYHAEIGQGWSFRSDKGYFTIYSTCDRETAWAAGQWADETYPDLVRLFGATPVEPPLVAVFNSVAQYNSFAAGDPAAGRPQSEADGFSSLHYAFFADLWFDYSATPPEYAGCGVAYWNREDPALDPFGKHAVRHAAAHSYIEEIDPSWNAVSQLVANPGSQFPSEAYWAEKRIPRWLRYGAASYCERYYHDPYAAEGNSWWARQWALQNLKSQGGLRPLGEVFAFNLDLNDLEGSKRLIHESGLLVSFLLDGKCQPLIQAHQAFKAKFRAGEDTKEAAAAIQAALTENEGELRQFAEL